jgi:hypothetical protein
MPTMSDWGSTNRVAALVALADGERIEGELHLLTRPAYPPGPESPLEMLNRPDPFFALTLADGAVIFISKTQVNVIDCREQPPLTDPDRISAAKLVGLEVLLQGGARYQGRATVELPPGRSRALDYVNGPGAFFTIFADDTTHYLNKARVRLIRPLD